MSTDVALADARPSVLWLDRPDAPEPLAPLGGAGHVRLVIVGGGFTGLWAALQAAERGLDVVLLERETIAHGGTGRNGGFCDASLTHGLANGLAHFPDEIDTLQRSASRTTEAIAAFVERARDRLRVRAGRRAHRRDAPARGGGARGGGRAAPRATGRTRSPSTATRCGARSTRRPTSPGCGAGTRARSSTRRAWRGACAGSRSSAACASTSTRRSSA